MATTRSYPTFVSRLITISLLLASGGLAWLFFGAGLTAALRNPNEPNQVEQILSEILKLCPDDPLLASRTASEWLYVAKRVAESEGIDGLRVLDCFGDEAVELFEKDRRAFDDLAVIVRLDGPLYAASTGPWRKAVLEWARPGHLKPFVDYLMRLGPDELGRLRETPECLPLLGQNAPIAKAMLRRHGSRAWQLFMLVDFAGSGPSGVERVARSLELFGDSMLAVCERYGLALALFFVPPPGDDQNVLPRLYRAAIDRLGVEEAGALFLSNYDDLNKLVLVENCSADEMVEALDLLAGQPTQVRELVSDSCHTMRLLLERRGPDHLGVAILSLCGPDAADLLYEPACYGSNLDEKEAALVVLRHCGPAGLRILERYKGWEPWHKFLRRSDLRDRATVPLLAKLTLKLSHSTQGQADIDAYLKMSQTQLGELEYPVTTSEQILEWVPGYLAARAVYDVSRGHFLDNSEIGWAVFDGVMTVSLVGKLAGQAIKTAGRQGAKIGFEDLARGVEREALSKLESNGARQATRIAIMRLPGGIHALIKALPSQALKLDVTQITRSASGVAKKVGVRTWGKLDRRIIMRGDRRVIMDLTDPEFLRLLGQEVSGNLKWEVACRLVGEFGPCVMEKVLPALSIVEGAPSP
jgi:hypothetical protein